MQTAHTRDTFGWLPQLTARIARIGLCLLLLVQLLLVALILIRGELPVPHFLLENLRKQFAKAGYTVDWKDVHINLTGQLLVQNLEVGAGEGKHNRLLSADGALVRFSVFRLLTGRFSPRSIVVEDASLFCPALFSPTGEVAIVLDDFSIDLRRTRENWNVHTFRAEVLGVRILADGNIPRSWFKAFAHDAFEEEAPAAAKPERSFLQRYGAAAHAILSLQPQLAELESPSIFINFSAFDQGAAHTPAHTSGAHHTHQPHHRADPFLAETTTDLPQFPTIADPADHLLVTLSLATQSYRNETLDLQAGRGLLRALLVFDADILPYVLGTPYSSLEQFKWGEHVSAERMFLQLPRLSAAGHSLQHILSTPLDALRFSAWKIDAYGFPLEQVRMRILSADGTPLLEAQDYVVHASIASGWNYFGALAHIDRASRSGWVDFVTDWNTDYLQQVPAQKLPSMLTGENVTGLNAPLHGSGHLMLAEGFRPAWGAAHLRVGDFSYGPLNVSYAHARAHWNGLSFAVDEAVVHSSEGYEANVSYWQNLHTDRYRVLAKGTINPLALSPIIGEAWWSQLWEDFEFSPRLWPNASFAMVGTHNMGTVGKQIFVQAQIDDAAYRKIPIQLASAFVFMDGERVDLYDFHVQTDRGEANVHVQWLWEKDAPIRKYLAFAAAGILPIEQAMLFVGPDTAAATANIRSEPPPRASVIGVLLGDQNHSVGEEVYLKLYADFPGELKTEWVNFDKVRAHMFMTPDTRVFPDIDAVFAGGPLAASVSIDLLPENQTAFKVDADLKSGHINRLEKSMPLLWRAEQQMAETFPETTEPGQQIALVQPAEAIGGNASSPLPQAAEVTTAATEQPTIASDTQYLLDKPGWLDFKGSIAGVAQQMSSINGSGTLVLRDADLGEIHVLGPLSRMLQFIGIPLATLVFDKAESNWSIKDGVIYFPDLNVSGNTGLLTASGNIDLETNNLNFIVYLRPFGEFNFPILSQALDLFSPLSNIFSIRITGSLASPQVQTNVSPGGIFSGRQSIDPHDMETPATADDPLLPPRKLRRPSGPGPR